MGLQISEVIGELRSWLPEQGTLDEFVHHNTLHHHEEHSFEDATELMGRKFGFEPYLSLSAFHRLYQSGRIKKSDLEEACREASKEISSLVGVDDPVGILKAVLMTNSENLSADQVKFLKRKEAFGGADAWAAVELAAGLAVDFAADEIHTRNQEDIQQKLTPVVSVELISRLAGAYLDQGIANFKLPNRHCGFWKAFASLVESADSSFIPWRRLVRKDDLELLSAGGGASASEFLSIALGKAGLTQDDAAEALAQYILPVRGWAGTFASLENRKSFTAHFSSPPKLLDFVAVCIAINPLSKEGGCFGHDIDRRGSLSVQLLQLMSSMDCLPQLDGLRLARVLVEVDDFYRRRVWQKAFEESVRSPFHRAVVHGARKESIQVKKLSFQAVFCIDEREESLRRLLEEVDQNCKTFGVAGHFEMDMIYKPVHGPGRPLCPPAVSASTTVSEYENTPSRKNSILKALLFPLYEHFVDTIHVFIFGAISFFDLPLNLILPSLRSRMFTFFGASTKRYPIRLLRTNENSGYSVEELADRVERLITRHGIKTDAGPILIVGHGSASLNNPHEAAYNCGACAGGRGVANARVFAMAANSKEVRENLRTRGVDIPDAVQFLACYHNTCNDNVDFMDFEFEGDPQLERVVAAIRRAAVLDAAERCRRFPINFGANAQASFRHVQARALMLHEPRPEYCHATNHSCIVGPRNLSSGIFLDRRTFLVSYDPKTDEDAANLSSILSAVVPVCAGINLEYYFSMVDNENYGSGTKLPHNVVGLIGVMNGFCGDLRTGLSRQMVEIHEPVRLCLYVARDRESLKTTINGLPQVKQLVKNRWLSLCAIENGNIFELYGEDFRPIRSDGLLERYRSVKNYNRTPLRHLAPVVVE